MSDNIRIAILGFSAFERNAMSSYMRLNTLRTPRYHTVLDVDAADFIVADADQAGVVSLLRTLGRAPDAVFVGAHGPADAAAWMLRPINPAHVMRELDALTVQRRDQLLRKPPAGSALAATPGPVPEPLPGPAGAHGQPGAAADTGTGSDTGPDATPRPQAAAGPDTLTGPGTLTGPDAASGLPARMAAAGAGASQPAGPAAADDPAREPPPVVPARADAATPPSAAWPATGPHPARRADDLQQRLESAALRRELSAALRRQRAAALRPQVLRRALLVDDSDIALHFLRRQLELYGVDTDFARHSDRALDLLDQHRYGMLFIDVDLGEMSTVDGLALCHAVRHRAASQPGAQVPLLVMVSAFHDPVDQVRGTLAGADAYLGKPLDFGALDRLLQRQGFTRLGGASPTLEGGGTAPPPAEG